ncbi:pectate lyase family protein [Aquiflexum gelatinilyticum]|uniref:Pectate lyase n=1 Tax=Aquiflexum gelatinilyticum TaxID=2961943 RepID=A0A9X2P8X4_9BACT|nr:pectate lyase [Aquiflexum gelatinilyticum]MCR9016483.1 pectate lyase [Aquiflexum gelatinilyticum]
MYKLITLFNLNLQLKYSIALNKLIVMIFFASSTAFSQISYNMDSTKTLSFPGAEGFGKFTKGGRGGLVFIVTNLNDSGPGSLRWALEAKGPRIIVFEVSGTIYLESSINVRNPNVTIAGQSAPGEGITVANYWLNFANMHNIIVRFIRFRPGDVSGEENQAAYGIYMENAIFDHCTFSWSTDEIATFYKVKNFTMQWSIISEALNNSVHSKGKHGYGSITGGKNVSWHHNLIAHATERMTMFDHTGLYKSVQEIQDWRGISDFRNNVIYNWQSRASSNGAEGSFNLINNYYKKGPASEGNRVDFILNPQRTGNGSTYSYGKFYVDGNILEGNEKITQDNWSGVRLENTPLHNEFFRKVKVSEPFYIPNGIYSFKETARESYEKVLSFAGASLHRDQVDKRIIHETKSGTHTFLGSKGSEGGIIDSQIDVGGWPELKSLPPLQDSDRDGMPNIWEVKMGLNPEKGDARFFDLDPNYTNIEVYLNSLVNHLMDN